MNNTQSLEYKTKKITYNKKKNIKYNNHNKKNYWLNMKLYNKE